MTGVSINTVTKLLVDAGIACVKYQDETLRNLSCKRLQHAIVFMKDLASRLSNRVQLTTDGLKFYMEAVGLAFHGDIDYAMLMKRYGTEPGGSGRYSPAVCLGCDKKEIRGNPEREYISTSFDERQNLTMRMRMRRFTRLTN